MAHLRNRFNAYDSHASLCAAHRLDERSTRRGSGRDERIAARRVSRAVSATFTALVLGLACSPAPGDHDPSTNPGASSEEEAFAEEIVAAFCDGLAGCCSYLSRTFERAACEAGVRARIAARAPAANTAMRFDPDAAAQCLANVRAALPSCKGIELEPCNRVYVGTLPSGSACTSGECAPVPDAQVLCAGTCRVYHRAAVGQSCARSCRTESQCGVLPGESAPDVQSLSEYGRCFLEDGLACVGGACVRAPGEGEECLGETFCDRGLYCDEVSERWTCVRLGGIGEPCTDVKCVPGAYCNDLENLCMPLKALGERCLDDEECASNRCGLDACEQDARGIPTCSGPICQSPTLGKAHGSASECLGEIHL